jgi:hypothetical protein
MLVQPLQMNASLYFLKRIKSCSNMQFKNYFFQKSLTMGTLSTNLNLSHPQWAELNIWLLRWLSDSTKVMERLTTRLVCLILARSLVLKMRKYLKRCSFFSICQRHWLLRLNFEFTKWDLVMKDTAVCFKLLKLKLHQIRTSLTSCITFRRKKDSAV